MTTKGQEVSKNPFAKTELRKLEEAEPPLFISNSLFHVSSVAFYFLLGLATGYAFIQDNTSMAFMCLGLSLPHIVIIWLQGRSIKKRLKYWDGALLEKARSMSSPTGMLRAFQMMEEKIVQAVENEKTMLVQEAEKEKKRRVEDGEAWKWN